MGGTVKKFPQRWVAPSNRALRRYGTDRRAWRVEVWILDAAELLLLGGAELQLGVGTLRLAPLPLWITTVLVVYPAIILSITHRVLRALFRPAS